VGEQSLTTAAPESAALDIARFPLSANRAKGSHCCFFFFRLRTVDHQYLSDVLYWRGPKAIADFV
jgi:hypothetical protein